MKGGLLIKEARRRASLTQSELAKRLGTSQSVVARWERGTREPSFKKTVEAVRACGFELSVSLPRYDEEHDIGLAAGILPLTPSQRLDRMVHFLREMHKLRQAARKASIDEPSFSPLDVIEVLQRHRVDYILIGALAAVLHGSPVGTENADICPNGTAENLDRLAEALSDMNARVRAPDSSERPALACHAEFLKNAEEWNLVTDYGQLDISFVPSGTRGYDDLRRDAIEIDIGGGVKTSTASLIDIIRSEEAAGGKSNARLSLLREMLDRFGEHL